jgi:hypothetical protein
MYDQYIDYLKKQNFQDINKDILINDCMDIASYTNPVNYIIRKLDLIYSVRDEDELKELTKKYNLPEYVNYRKMERVD